MARLSLLLLVAVLGATPRLVHAHIEPVLPSTCAFDPLTLTDPVTGTTGQASAATTADTIRIVYDTATSSIQACPAGGDPNQCGTPAPRAFTFGGAAGTLTFPSLFPGHMQSTGDLTLSDVPVTFTVGGETATVPVTVTTALTAVGGRVEEGTPLDMSHGFTVIGVVDAHALPVALGGRALVLTMSCRPDPVPDLDQFALIGDLAPIAGAITSKGARLKGRVDTFGAPAPDFAGRPTMIAVHVGGTTIATALFSGGLQGTRKLTATSDDGNGTFTVRVGRAGRFAVAAQLDAVTLPSSATPGARVPVDVTLDTGGTLARGERTFRVRRNGKALHPR